MAQQLECNILQAYFQLGRPTAVTLQHENRSILIVRPDDDPTRLLVLIASQKHVNPKTVMEEYLNDGTLELVGKPLLFWLSLTEKNKKYNHRIRLSISSTYPACNQANFPYIQRHLSKYLPFHNLEWNTDLSLMYHLREQIPKKLINVAIYDVQIDEDDDLSVHLEKLTI